LEAVLKAMTRRYLLAIGCSPEEADTLSKDRFATAFRI
jgi:hypothetical protein